MLDVRQPGVDVDGRPEQIRFAIDRQVSAPRAAEQPPLRHVTQELRVKLLEPRAIGIKGPQPPHLAAAEIEHAAGAVELTGHVDRQLLAGGGRILIGKAGIDGRPGFLPLHAIVAIHSLEIGPIVQALGGRRAEPEEFGLLPLAGELDRRPASPSRIWRPSPESSSRLNSTG